VATVLFYQKLGCRTNARQKQMLETAGHTVITRNLVAEPWTADTLRSFFGVTPVASWFNPASPRLKSGEIDPAKLDAARALALMLDDPLLIRRPLLDVAGQKCAGFDLEPVTSLLAGSDLGGVQGCRRLEASRPCSALHQPEQTPQP
jgi:nitrogenase-associated protein